jgi:hypothetical protein
MPRIAEAPDLEALQAGFEGRIYMAVPSEELFTARQIAGALDNTKRAVLLALTGVKPPGKRRVRGQYARAWSFCSLPGSMQRQIERVAQDRGYRNAEALLQDCGIPAQALPTIVAAGPETASGRDLHSDLRAAFMDYLPDRSNLSLEDRGWVWRETCRHYEAIAAGGPESRNGTLARSLTEFLLREVPGLVKPGARHPARALARDFHRKLARYRKLGPEALRDGREAHSGYYRAILCAQCWEKALALDVGFRTNESLAWRTLKESGQMCERCAGRHKLDVQQNKSYVPPSVRDALTPLANAALPWLKSPAAGRMAGPYIPGDWSDTEPGDVFIADDVTFNHEVYDFAPSGKLFFFRPECLYFSDARTGYPLAWRLIRGHYNGRHIRLVMRDVVSVYGRPRVGFKFENGVWSSRTARDESRKGWIDFRETEDGFKSMRMLFEISHAQARNPRGKAALEGEFKILQEQMRLERGYVGFNQREEQSDAIKASRRQALGGDKKALAQFHSFENWATRLEQIFDGFANDSQNGASNDGISPKEHWRLGVERNPLQGLPDDVQWILSTHRDVASVTAKGILIDYGKHEHWTYAGGPLSRFIGKNVLTHYHIDCPELLTVCDMKRTEYFTVKGIRLPATTATAEQIGEAQRQIAAFNRTPKAIAGMLKHPIISMITRDNEFPPEQRELGREIERNKREHRELVQRTGQARANQRNEGLRLVQAGLAALETEQRRATDE